jgi:hypothetical protein
MRRVQMTFNFKSDVKDGNCQSRLPRDLLRGFAAVGLLGLWVRILAGVWMSVCCECRLVLVQGTYIAVGKFVSKPHE